MPRISRRAVFVGSGALGLLAVGGAVGWRIAADAHAALRAMVLNHLRGAAVADGAIDAFVADFLGAYGVHRDGIAIGNACDALALDGAAEACVNNAAYLQRLEERAIDLFIRSTDLFSPDRRPGDPIRYVAFWDPYSAACRNPFADLT